MKLSIIITILILFISCGNKTSQENKIDVNSNLLFENNRAIINTDCDYYISYGINPSGRFHKGQVIEILDLYIHVVREDGDFNIFVEVRTTDEVVKGYVNEQYITYLSDINNDLWFKNILLTREYYYLETAEDIYNREYLGLLDEGVEKTQSVRMMGHFFSELRLLVSERYFILGNLTYSVICRLHSVNKDNNTYTLRLLNQLKEEYEIILFVDDSGVIITHSSHSYEKDGNYYENNILSNSLNIRYVQYNKDKTEILKENIRKWVQENRWQ